MIETWGKEPSKGGDEEEPSSVPTKVPSIEQACIHNWNGYCAFLLSEYLDPETRQACRLCPQWATGRAEWKEKLKVPYDRGVARYWDLVRLNPSLAKMYRLKPLKTRSTGIQ